MECTLHCESCLFPFVLHLFCLFVYLFVWLPHGSHRGRYFMEIEKKNKAKVPWEAAKEAERESLTICNSSLWSLAASQPLKCMKRPCILMINSLFGLASSCIFLLVATGRVLTNSSKVQKELGQHAWKGSGGRAGSGHETPDTPLAHPQAWLGHLVGSMRSLRRLKLCPARGVQWRWWFLLQKFCPGLSC